MRPTEKHIEIWFFRDLIDEQRLKLFSLMGMPVNELTTHGAQKQALRHALSAALAVEAGAVGVKPLAWVEGDGLWTAQTQFVACYSVWDVDTDTWRCSLLDGEFPTAEAAKAAAQADFEARIRSSLATEGAIQTSSAPIRQGEGQPEGQHQPGQGTSATSVALQTSHPLEGHLGDKVPGQPAREVAYTAQPSKSSVSLEGYYITPPLTPASSAVPAYYCTDCETHIAALNDGRCPCGSGRVVSSPASSAVEGEAAPVKASFVCGLKPGEIFVAHPEFPPHVWDGTQMVRLGPDGREAVAAREAERLARWLHKMHYSDVAQWKPLSGDVAGLISQIDNMVVGLERPVLVEWQCRDYADGWIDFPSLSEALAYHRETGAVMRPAPSLSAGAGGEERG